MRKIIPITWFLWVFLHGVALGSANQISIKEVLDKADKQYRFQTSYAELEMKIKTQYWERTMRLNMWTKGMKKTLIVIKAPKKDSGITTLRIDKSMWNYFPKINKVIKVPPSMMMGSWMGTDFTNDDLVKESTFVNDFNAKFIPGQLEDFYYIELRPKETTISVWDKVRLVINKKSLILKKQESFNERGEKVRTITFSNIRDLGGKIIPTTIIVTSHKKKGNQTIINYIDAKFNQPMKDTIFTYRQLQKRR